MKVIRVSTYKPVCIICKKTIHDDLSIILDDNNPFDSCICTDCRDDLKENLKEISPVWENLLLPSIDARVDTTPISRVEILKGSVYACG